MSACLSFLQDSFLSLFAKPIGVAPVYRRKKRAIYDTESKWKRVASSLTEISVFISSRFISRIICLSINSLGDIFIALLVIFDR